MLLNSHKFLFILQFIYTVFWVIPAKFTMAEMILILVSYLLYMNDIGFVLG